MLDKKIAHNYLIAMYVYACSCVFMCMYVHECVCMCVSMYVLVHES